MSCVHCDCALNVSRRHHESAHKSCPNCSETTERKEHVYLPDALFGVSGPRKTPNNNDGIQSWCSVCRTLQSENRLASWRLLSEAVFCCDRMPKQLQLSFG